MSDHFTTWIERLAWEESISGLRYAFRRDSRTDVLRQFCVLVDYLSRQRYGCGCEMLSCSAVKNEEDKEENGSNEVLRQTRSRCLRGSRVVHCWASAD